MLRNRASSTIQLGFIFFLGLPGWCRADSPAVSPKPSQPAATVTQPQPTYGDGANGYADVDIQIDRQFQGLQPAAEDQFPDIESNAQDEFSSLQANAEEEFPDLKANAQKTFTDT